MDAITLMLWTGKVALYLLCFILAIRPLVKQDKRFRWLFKQRQNLGIAFGILMILHVVIYLFLYIDSWSFLLKIWDAPWFVLGAVAFVITLVLTLTSNRWSQRKLKKHWKTLHKLTYVIFPLGAIHGLLSAKVVFPAVWFLLILWGLLMLYRYRNYFGGITLIVSLLVSGFYLYNPQITRATPSVIIKPNKADDPIAWERCGQYGLDYFNAPNGFYNCERRNNQ